MRPLLAEERGDWSYIASFTFVLCLIAALSLAIDAESVAYGRARLWAAVATAARAGARCLRSAPTQGADACVKTTVTTLVAENLATAWLRPVAVSASLQGAGSVRVSVTADLAIPLSLPGVASPLPLTDSATAVLLPAAASTQE